MKKLSDEEQAAARMAEMRSALAGARGESGGDATDAPAAADGRRKLNTNKFGGLMAKLDGQLAADGATTSSNASKAARALTPVEPRSKALKAILAEMSSAGDLAPPDAPPAPPTSFEEAAAQAPQARVA